MGRIAGSASVEIDAPVAVVFAVAADVERMPDWQAGLLAAAVLERDRSGQARRVQIETHHGAALLRFDYREPVAITWRQEEGDAAHFAGTWRFEAMDATATRATYDVEVDFGRAWGLLIGGPVKAKLRERFVDAMPLRLRDQVEATVYRRLVG